MYEFNRVKRGIETFLKTVISEIRDKWNRDKRGLPVHETEIDSRGNSKNSVKLQW